MKAMILASGSGERMRPLTEHTHKSLIKIDDESLIVRHIKRLKAAGFTDIVINLCHLGHLIQGVIQEGKKYGVRVQYVREETPLGSGGSIYNALPFLGDDPFLILSADIWTDFDFKILPKTLNDLAHLILISKPNTAKEDALYLDHELISLKGDKAHVFSGIGILHPKLFSNVKTKKFPLMDILRPAIENQKIHGEIYKGILTNLNTMEDLKKLEEQLRI